MKKLYFISILFSFSVTIISCSKSITDPEVLILRYLRSKTITERLQYVSDTSRVKSFMQKYYEHADIPDLVSIKDIRKIENLKFANNIRRISIEASYKNKNGLTENNINDFYVIDTQSNGLKIDWLSTTGINPKSFRSFQLAKTTEIGTFRFTCELSDYYNYGYYGKQDKYYSVECYVPLEEITVYCYIRKTSEDGKKIFEILKDGTKRNLVLSVKYDYRSINNDDALNIKKLVSDEWYYDENASITIPETLQDYVLYSALDSTIKFVTIEENSQRDPFVRNIKQDFQRDNLLILSEIWFKGRRISENREECYLDDELLAVTSFSGYNILGGSSYDNTIKTLVKMPHENEKTNWSYTNKDGYVVSCISEFTEIDVNGKLNKAIKVTERSTFLKDAFIERLYVKEFGFYNEIGATDGGRILYQVKLSE